MMLNELNARHEGEDTNMIDSYNVKESIGGLRDIEAVLLMYKAKYELLEPVNHKLISQLCQIRTDLTYCFNELKRAFKFLKTLRNVYRLIIAADDLIEQEYVERVAKVMHLEGGTMMKPGERLIKKYMECKKNVVNISKELINAIEYKD